MEHLELKEFFNRVGYDWKKDKENIKTICHYTKTRVNPKMKEVRLTWGTEQTFVIVALCEFIQAKKFFEIGTGRGTACYATALVPSVEAIHTVDILQFKQKFSTAIGFKPANVSLSDILQMIPFPEKSKVHFHHRKEFKNLRAMGNQFDFAFIDGDHDTKGVILEDYEICDHLVKPGGIIVWDDYDPERFAVKGIVDDLLAKDSSLDAVLVEQRGHLFNDKPAEHGKGMVLMKRGKLW